jgi:predicted AlkP superfamily pyrophosphatase or phosphodiesterase
MKRGCGWAALFLGLTLGCGPGAQKPMRIVLVTLDTLRYDSFAEAGNMPFTRALAEQARVFRRHYASTSATQPTHASLFTGLQPWEHGVTRNSAVLADEFETVAERLRESGFRTAAVVASFPLHRRFGFAQGFDSYQDEFQEEGKSGFADIGVPGGLYYNKADSITGRGMALLDELSGPRQFIWLHYFDPHAPYGDNGGPDPIERGPIMDRVRSGQPAAPLIARARRNYDHDVRTLDQSLNRLYRRLQRDAEQIETHLVIVADHGESFGEGGVLGHGKHVSEEQIHVPLLIHSPGARPGVVDAPCGSIDVATTLLALAGIEAGATGGRDLLQSDGRGSAVFGMRRIFARPAWETRIDASRHPLAAYEFYAIRGDRIVKGNQSGVSSNDAEPVPAGEAAELETSFATFEERLAAIHVEERIDPETQRALESLGYLR